MKNQKIAVFCQSYFNIGKPFSRILYMKMPPCGTIVPHGGAEFPEYFCFSLLFVDFSLWPTPRERSFGRGKVSFFREGKAGVDSINDFL